MIFCATLYAITLFDNQHRVALRAKKDRKHEKHQKSLSERKSASGVAQYPLSDHESMKQTSSITSPHLHDSSFLSEDFAAIGRRLECLELVSSQAERLQRVTLVRQPRRRATAYLATEALRVPGDFVEAVSGTQL